MSGIAGTMTLAELRVRLADAGATTNWDWQPFLKVTAVLLGAATKENFDRGQSPDGTPWNPLAWPRARGGSKPLRDRGLLMASTSARGAGHVEEYGADSLVFGTNHESAALHQHGGTIRPRKGKFLAIPLTKEAARSGRPRGFPDPLHFASRDPSRGGALMDKKGKAHFALVKQVTVPARPFLGFNPALLEKIDNAAADHAVRQLTRRI